MMKLLTICRVVQHSPSNFATSPRCSPVTSGWREERNKNKVTGGYSRILLSCVQVFLFLLDMVVFSLLSILEKNSVKLTEASGCLFWPSSCGTTACRNINRHPVCSVAWWRPEGKPQLLRASAGSSGAICEHSFTQKTSQPVGKHSHICF